MYRRPVLCLVLFLSAYAGASAAQGGSPSKEDFNVILESAREHLKSSDYDSCRVDLLGLFTLAKNANNQRWQGIALNQLGILCLYEGKYAKAMENCHDAIPFLEAVDDSTALADCHNTLGSIYFLQKNYHGARNSYKRSYSMLKPGNDPWSLGNALNNLGLVYSKVGLLDSALYYHQESLKIWNKNNKVSGRAITLEHIGNCLSEMGREEEALEKLLDSRELMQDGRAATVLEISIGQLRQKLGQFGEAVKWCTSALETSEANKFNKDAELSCECLYRSYLELGDTAKAYRYYTQYVQMRDSLFGQEKTKEITELEMQYAFEKQQLADSLRYVAETELREERIQRQRIGLVSIGGMLFLAAALAVVIYQSKQKSDSLLLNILPKQTADELKKTGKAASRSYDSATVLFTDFKGFTAASEQLSPQELVDEINTCFSEFDRICASYGVEKIKTIGDAYMAVGGVPEPSADSVKQTINAALEMQEFMVEHAENMRKQGKPVLQMRVGIHTGPVVAGIVGLNKFQYDIWGDTVNTASRLESSGEVVRVNVSESTYSLAKNDFAFEPRGKIEAKGKGKIAMYFVSREKA